MSQGKLPDPDPVGRRLAAAAERVRLFVRVRLGSRLRARFEIEDVLQETLAAALVAWERFEDRGDGSLVRWLCRIAETTIRSLAEREGALKRTPPGERERITRALRRMEDDATGPATAAGRAEKNAAVARSLEMLDEDEREIVLARFFRGLPFEEVAREAGISVSTARRRMGRALLALGEILT